MYGRSAVLPYARPEQQKPLSLVACRGFEVLC